jgi:hypothetical protein
VDLKECIAKAIGNYAGDDWRTWQNIAQAVAADLEQYGFVKPSKPDDEPNERVSPSE